jgi:hypothetical protein
MMYLVGGVVDDGASRRRFCPGGPGGYGWRNGGRMGGEGERRADKDSGGEVSPGI